MVLPGRLLAVIPHYQNPLCAQSEFKLKIWSTKNPGPLKRTKSSSSPDAIKAKIAEA